MKIHKENDADPIVRGHRCRSGAGDCSRGCAGCRAPCARRATHAPPTPEVTFKVEVNYVEEDVRVVDQGRQLRPRVEAGRLPGSRGRQAAEGSDLRHGRHPEHAAAQAAVPRARRAADRARRGGQQTGARRPLYLIVLDDYHVAPLRSQNVRNLARRFVLEKLGPDDQAAVVVTSGLQRASQDFTQNRRLLVEAIDNFVGQKLPSSAVERNETDVARDGQPRDSRSTMPAIPSRSIRRTGTSPTTAPPSACSRRVRR